MLEGTPSEQSFPTKDRDLNNSGRSSSSVKRSLISPSKKLLAMDKKMSPDRSAVETSSSMFRPRMTAARRKYGWKGGKRKRRRRTSAEGEREGKDDDEGEEGEDDEDGAEWRTDGHAWLGKRVMREVGFGFVCVCMYMSGVRMGMLGLGSA
jgi:hypothetical protein